MSHQDEDCGRTYCPVCGCDSPGCGCPDTDPGTMALMRCPTGHQWWRRHDSTSSTCIHDGCGKTSEVTREPKYAPSVPA